MMDAGPYFIHSVSVFNHLQKYEQLWSLSDDFSQDYRPADHLQNVSPDVFTRAGEICRLQGFFAALFSSCNVDQRVEASHLFYIQSVTFDTLDYSSSSAVLISLTSH